MLSRECSAFVSAPRSGLRFPARSASAGTFPTSVQELLQLQSHFPLVLPHMETKLEVKCEEETLVLKGSCHLQRERKGLGPVTLPWLCSDNAAPVLQVSHH